MKGIGILMRKKTKYIFLKNIECKTIEELEIFISNPKRAKNVLDYALPGSIAYKLAFEFLVSNCTDILEIKQFIPLIYYSEDGLFLFRRMSFLSMNINMTPFFKETIIYDE